jgi:hypothetical protein
MGQEKLYAKQRIKKCMKLSRWLIAYLPPVLILFAVLIASIQPLFTLALIMVVLGSMLAGFIIATIGVLRLSCWHCGEGFLSVTYPTWPFQSWCVRCSTRVDEPDE